MGLCPARPLKHHVESSTSRPRSHNGPGYKHTQAGSLSVVDLRAPKTKPSGPGPGGLARAAQAAYWIGLSEKNSPQREVVHLPMVSAVGFSDLMTPSAPTCNCTLQNTETDPPPLVTAVPL